MIIDRRCVFALTGVAWFLFAGPNAMLTVTTEDDDDVDQLEALVWVKIDNKLCYSLLAELGPLHGEQRAHGILELAPRLVQRQLDAVEARMHAREATCLVRQRA
jgi:hypothetical protein